MLLLHAVNVLMAMQVAQATVSGTVLSEHTGVPVTGVLVSLADLGRSTLTDAAGRYVLREVPAGPQHVSVRAIGFHARTLHALVPADGKLEINVSLKALPIRLTPVAVVATVAVPGAESGAHAPFPDRSASLAAIRNHPLVAEPDALQALVGGAVVAKPESPGGLFVRGGASDHTGYALDGIPVFSPYHAAGLFSAWNADAIARVSLASAMPSPAYADALSGTVDAATRTPSSRFGSQGALSNTQARVTVDGPAGIDGASYLISGRTSVSGMVTPRDEPSYERGSASDLIARLELPAFGGTLRVLSYNNDNEIAASSLATEAAPGAPVPAHGFEWKSHSLGATWQRTMGTHSFRVAAWQASADNLALWRTEQAGRGSIAMTSARRDYGLLVDAEHVTTRGVSSIGVRAERIGTSYAIAADSASDAMPAMNTRAPVLAAFVQHQQRLSDGVETTLGASVSSFDGAARFAPRARVAWRATSRMIVSGAYARTHQFAQSLRNSESVAGTLFPADVFVAAGKGGVPVAQSDQGVIAADLRASPSVRIGWQAYTRRLAGIVSAARNGEPFAARGFLTGRGTSQGTALDIAVSRAKWGATASYGLQRTHRTWADTSYVPGHGDAHTIDAGVVLFPTPTLSLKLGTSIAAGRRTTIGSGSIEFESCNLIDRGCEFRGSPDYTGAQLGAARLPAYARVDLGVEKHWHIGDETQIAAFATLTNVLSHHNVLTYVRDPATGSVSALRLRPFSPLVAGLSWRY